MRESEREPNLSAAPTYEELSRQCRQTFRNLKEIIALMYIYLVEKRHMSYRRAVNKIWEDHKDIEGFSSRKTIVRQLPMHASIERRIRRSGPKNKVLTRSVEPSKKSAKSYDEADREFQALLKGMGDSHDAQLAKLIKIEEKKDALVARMFDIIRSMQSDLDESKIRTG